MKIYAIKYYYEVDTFGACDDQVDHCGYYATEEIAMAHLEDKVATTRNWLAFQQALEKECDVAKRSELREAYENGEKFEYTPAPNEKPMWFEANEYCPARYYPFAIYDERAFMECNKNLIILGYKPYKNYEQYLVQHNRYNDASSYYCIEEIEVIDA